MSGNVWEWTRSAEANYPYPSDAAGRAQREDLPASEDALRVLRGGAFLLPPRLVRCAARGRDRARRVLSDAGFRVAVAVLPSL